MAFNMRRSDFDKLNKGKPLGKAQSSDGGTGKFRGSSNRPKRGGRGRPHPHGSRPPQRQGQSPAPQAQQQAPQAQRGQHRPPAAPHATNGALVIVESPAKCRTIEKILGKHYQVVASMGHIIDLPKSKMGIDVDNGFKPQYIVLKEKKKVLNGLKDAI